MKHLLILLLVLTTSLSQAKTFMWKVEKDGQHAYIGGTVHLLRAEDEIPATYYKAYQASDVLVTEVELEELLGAAFAMSAMGMAEEGQTLDKVLSPEVYEQFVKFCQDNKFPLDSLTPLKPQMASINIVMGLMMRQGATPEGVDMTFSKMAMQDDKKRIGLETAMEQFDAIFNKDVDPDKIILSTLQDAKEAGTLLDKMISGLFAGEVEMFKKEFLDAMKTETPAFYDSLVVRRNNNWVPKVEAMIATPEVELILVGGLHLVGDIGVIEQLKAKGYTVTQLD
ncbi:MAG: TraB/GumN family protein [Gammaproteobacteria bacterium]|nr:TraB/GumN family protein [Gammaproteobacteria bacterium]